MRIVLPSFILLLSASVLPAADFTGGIMAGAALPQGDLKTISDNSTGFNLTLFGRWDLGQGHAIRARLDGTGFTGSPNTLPLDNATLNLKGNVDVTTSIGVLGADYLYYFDKTTAHGFYAGGGLGLAGNTVKLEYNGLSTDHTHRSLAAGLYLGYQFTPHWNAELSYRTSKFQADAVINGSTYTASYTLPSVGLSVGWTF